jgi:hypothetical protein
MTMKTIFAVAFAATTLISTAAFAGSESSQNGIPVTSTMPLAREIPAAPRHEFQALAHAPMAYHSAPAAQSSIDPATNPNLGK